MKATGARELGQWRKGRQRCTFTELENSGKGGLDLSVGRLGEVRNLLALNIRCLRHTSGEAEETQEHSGA